MLASLVIASLKSINPFWHSSHVIVRVAPLVQVPAHASSTSRKKLVTGATIPGQKLWTKASQPAGSGAVGHSAAMTADISLATVSSDSSHALKDVTAALQSSHVGTAVVKVTAARRRRSSFMVPH